MGLKLFWPPSAMCPVLEFQEWNFLVGIQSLETSCLHGMGVVRIAASLYPNSCWKWPLCVVLMEEIEEQHPLGTSEWRREETRPTGAQQGCVRVVTSPLSPPWSEWGTWFLYFCLAVSKNQGDTMEGCVRGFPAGSWPWWLGQRHLVQHPR